MEDQSTNQSQTTGIPADLQNAEAAPQSPVQAEKPEQLATDQAYSTESVAETNPQADAVPKEFGSPKETERLKAELSEVRRRENEAKTRYAQMVLQQEIVRLEQEEAQAQVRDKQAVENGDITQEQANANRQARWQHYQLQQRNARMQHILEQQSASAEANARIITAQKIGQEWGLTNAQVETMIADKEVRNPVDMERKAARLAIGNERERTRTAGIRSESFDRGPGAGSEVKAEEQRLKDRYPSMYGK